MDGHPFGGGRQGGRGGNKGRKKGKSGTGNYGRGGKAGSRNGRGGGQQLKLSPRVSETGSDVGGVDFLGDLDQFLADYKDDEEGQLADTLDRVNLEDDFVPFGSSGLHQTGSSRSNSSQMTIGSIGSMGSMGSMSGNLDGIDQEYDDSMMLQHQQQHLQLMNQRGGGKKKKLRPKLEQMPSDAFPLHSMDPVSPFTGSFEWANQEGTSVPNSMTTPNPLGSPTNLFSPHGNMLDLDGDDL